ncbi:MAG: 30S ribosomal protein S12 methylthiotransferase RimO [Deferribacteres bacterium]|nr:30S ribosomal protein S12 methylthiotransferase RimO [candidate division KSB1 bacterium]MCB9503331.1 30S ribosomal protein S12 methylthiotransferase RimO [Deferribacteres bacterium]
MKVRLITLGCPKNLVDSEFLAGGLAKNGVQFIEEAEDADAIIINTCGFIESAKEESIETILQAAELKKTGRCQQLLVTGCLTQRYGDELRKEIPEIDGLYGNRDLNKILKEMARQLLLRTGLLGERHILTPKHYAYLKISEGCEHPCTFCAIPQIRGAFTGKKIETLVQETEHLASHGVKELVLIAQDSTQYGLDVYGEKKLPQLLTALNQVDGIEWIRLMYAYPYHLTEAMIDAVASLDKVCNYIDMPVQHCSDSVLKRMARRVTAQFQQDLINNMRERIPGLTLRTSLIVGFPGETEEDFHQLYDYVSEGYFDRLGIFTYSHEEGTPAARFEDDVPEEVKRERQDLLYQAQADVAEQKNSAFRNKELRILIDEYDAYGNNYLGRTEADAPEIDNSVIVHDKCEIGNFYKVRIKETSSFEMIGELTARDNTKENASPIGIRLPIAQES